MVKLSPDLILGAAQSLNPCRERELDLRGYKIPLIEHLGATLDQFDVIDFSDNELRKMDNFPFLPRMKGLLLNNNRICRFGEQLEESLPQLNTLILTNNNIQELADLETLSSVKTLTMLSLLHNPVVAKTNYRLFTIHKFPTLRVLDFRKVKQSERESAKKLFKSRAGKDQLKEIKKRAQTFLPGEPLDGDQKNGKNGRRAATNASGLTPAQVRSIKTAIAQAGTLEEIERLNQILRAGHIPGEEVKAKAPKDPIVEMEED